MASRYSILVMLLFAAVAKLAAQTIEVIDPSPRSVVGTAPYWCKETRSLYYCDLYRTDACTILRYCPADNRVYCATVDNFPTTTFIIPAKGTPDCFVVGANHTVILVRWDGKSPKAKWICNLFEVENCPEYASNNFDEGKADRYGRLYAGTYRGQICNDLDTPTYANLFRFSDDKPAVTLIEPNTVRASSGMAWDYKINKFYWIESCDWTVRSFDWCPYTGDISNQKMIYNYTDGYGNPLLSIKGMDIDKDGRLWLSSFGGSEIIKLDPRTGNVMRIPFPTAQVSSLTFGGDDMDCLFVTTASLSVYGEVTDIGGKLFKVCGIGAQGNYPHKVDLKCKQKSKKWAEL